MRVRFDPMVRTLVLALVAAAAFAQQKPPELKFEVASIKPSDPNPSNRMFIGMSADGAMVHYTNITLLDCIRGAYRVREFQVVGPDWITKSRFQIDAKMPPGASSDDIPEMLKALLVERFKLEIRRDTKDQNVFALLVSSGGAKLKPAERKQDANAPKALGPDGKPRDMMMYALPPGGVSITAPSASLASVAWLMSRFTARPVVDMTGLEGQYDIKLTFAPQITPDPAIVPRPGPTLPGLGPDTTISAVPAQSVFDAVKEYGLRLEARKAPIERIVVTHLEMTPTEN